jgi:hypothetical protein
MISHTQTHPSSRETATAELTGLATAGYFEAIVRSHTDKGEARRGAARGDLLWASGAVKQLELAV